MYNTFNKFNRLIGACSILGLNSKFYRCFTYETSISSYSKFSQEKLVKELQTFTDRLNGFENGKIPFDLDQFNDSLGNKILCVSILKKLFPGYILSDSDKDYVLIDYDKKDIVTQKLNLLSSAMLLKIENLKSVDKPKAIEVVKKAEILPEVAPSVVETAQKISEESPSQVPTPEVEKQEKILSVIDILRQNTVELVDGLVIPSTAVLSEPEVLIFSKRAELYAVEYAISFPQTLNIVFSVLAMGGDSPSSDLKATVSFKNKEGKVVTTTLGELLDKMNLKEIRRKLIRRFPNYVHKILLGNNLVPPLALKFNITGDDSYWCFPGAELSTNCPTGIKEKLVKFRENLSNKTK